MIDDWRHEVVVCRRLGVEHACSALEHGGVNIALRRPAPDRASARLLVLSLDGATAATAERGRAGSRSKLTLDAVGRRDTRSVAAPFCWRYVVS
jgi:hypothetical protein